MSETSAVEASAVAISQKITVSSGGVSFLGFVAKVDVFAWGGLIIAAIGLAIQFYFAVQKNRREKIEHEMRTAEYKLRIENLKGDCNVKQD
ncbi:holin [Acinetobacter proteolyticus]|uniref:holin n=1 Tax=Acinetobacter higginsii TaxID=70347 RepID=UPI0023BAED48|nr:holin [Acinetobacter proteolyticus]WEI17156.1 holin [Acinetobacter proteolyticus]